MTTADMAKASSSNGTLYEGMRTSAFYQAAPEVFQILQIEVNAEAQQKRSPVARADAAEVNTSGSRSSFTHHPQASTSTFLTVEDTSSQQRKRPRSADFSNRAKGAVAAAARLSWARSGKGSAIGNLKSEQQSTSSEGSSFLESDTCWVRQVSLLLPQVRADMQGAVPLDVSSRIEVREGGSDMSNDGHWSHQKTGKAVFVSDREDEQQRISPGRLHRNFSESSRSSVVIHETVDEDPTELSKDKALQSKGLPLVTFPSSEPTAEKSLGIGFVLRQISALSEEPTSPTSSRTAVRGPRPFRGSSSTSHEQVESTIASSSQSQLLFVAAPAMRQLINAIRGTNNVDGRLLGPLASEGAAKLEGLVLVPVQHSEDSLKRGQNSYSWQCPRQLLSRWTQHGGAASKFACAFVHQDNSSGDFVLLASLQLVIRGGESEGQSMLPENVPRSSIVTTSRTRPASMSPRRVPSPRAVDFPQSSCASPLSANRHSTSVVGHEGTPRVQDRFYRSTSTPTKPTSIVFERLAKLDRIELELRDAEMDSPIFRAALSSLEKRTNGMSKTASTLRKAALDCVASLDTAVQADGHLDEALLGACSWTPATSSLLVEKHLLERRKQTTLLREQESRLLVVHVIAPMEGIEERCRELLESLKSFDSESQAFYSATQKWLSLKGTRSRALPSDVLPQSDSDAEICEPTASKLQRENDKQKLRQARYDLSRIRLFQSATMLHGGEAELKVAAHYLALTRWHGAMRYTAGGASTEVPETNSLSDIETMLKIHGTKTQAKLVATATKCTELTMLIEKLEAQLNVCGTDAVEWPRAAMQSEVDVASGARNGGRKAKIKTLLSHLTTKNTNQPLGSRIRRISGLSPLTRTTDSAAHDNPEIDWNAIPVSSDSATDSSDQTRRQSSRVESHGSNVDGLTASNGPTTQSSVQPTISHTTEAEKASKGPSPQPGPLARAVSTSSQVAPHPKERKKEGVLWVLSKELGVVNDSEAVRHAGRGSKWHESWVVLSGSGHLGEYSGWKDTKSMKLEATRPLVDLRFATTREARGLDRRFVFEVITRDCRRLYQAASEKEMRGWIAAIRFAIECLLNGTSSVRQVEKVAKASVANAAFASGGGDFGAGALLDRTMQSPPLAAHRPFSQSMTDLGFTHGPVAKGAPPKKKGKTQDAAKRESLQLTASQAAHIRGPSLEIPWRRSEKTAREPILPSEKRNVSHARGISNNTPVSGYIAGTDSRTKPLKKPVVVDKHEDLAGKRRQTRKQSEADRQIEEAVTRHFGAPSGPQSSSQAHESSDADSDCNLEGEGEQRYPGTPTRLPSASSKNLTTSTILRADTLHRRYVSTGSCFAPTKFGRAQEIQGIAGQPCNSTCGDCGRANPRWASWAIHGQACCIFVCIACSGIHRSLGVDVCKVKSVDLDDWNEEQLQAARDWGNERVNAFFEAAKPPGVTVDTLGGTRTRQFWKQKYIQRAWYKDMTATVSLHRTFSSRQRPARTPLLHFEQFFEGDSKAHHSDENSSTSQSRSSDGRPQDLLKVKAQNRRPLSTLS